jgi:hypothetical protein
VFFRNYLALWAVFGSRAHFKLFYALDGVDGANLWSLAQNSSVHSKDNHPLQKLKLKT